MSRFSRDRSWRDDLNTELSDLRSELADLRDSMGRRSSRAVADTRGFGSDFGDYLRELFYHNRPAARRSARRALRAVEDHPAATATTALVALGVVGLAVGLFMQQRSGGDDR